MAGLSLGSLESSQEVKVPVSSWISQEMMEIFAPKEQSLPQQSEKSHSKGQNEEVKSDSLPEVSLVSEKEKTDTIDTLNAETAKKVFITLDDGPNAHTRDILKMLDSLWQKATFFRVGRNVGEKYRSVAQDLRAQGHELGSHSFGHENFAHYSTLSDVKHNIEQVEAHFDQVGQSRPQYFRYPYGSKVKQGLNSDFLAYLQQKGYQKPVFWDIDTRDRDKKVSREKMKQSLLKVKPGDIILLHENKRALGETLILIDSILDARNLQSAPLSEKFEKN